MSEDETHEMPIEPEPPDPVPAMMAHTDQLLALLPHQARLAMGIFNAYLDAGFDDEQAWDVVRLYLMEWIA